MSTRRVARILRFAIKGIGVGLAAGAALIAYWFSTITELAFPIFGALMLLMISLMVVAAVLTMLY